jgi:hypothetical protein
MSESATRTTPEFCICAPLAPLVAQATSKIIAAA